MHHGLDRIKDQSLSNRAQRLVFSSVSGEPLTGYPENTFAAKFRRVLWGLHEAKFAPPLLRWLLFFLGVISSAMIATGLIYWLKIRTKTAQIKSIAHHLVERLNIAIIAGMSLAIAAYFIANRLLPIDTVGRSSLEVNYFFIAWLAAAVHAFFRSPKVAWQEQLTLSGLAFLSVFLIDFVQDKQRILNAIETNNWPYISVSISLLIASILLLTCASKLKNARIKGA